MVEEYKFSINKIKSNRRVSWNNYSMLYHVLIKVLMLFIIFMFIYMMMIYNRIQVYELNLAENVERELKIIARQASNNVLKDQMI